jgi:hypothetical protein
LLDDVLVVLDLELDELELLLIVVLEDEAEDT